MCVVIGERHEPYGATIGSEAGVREAAPNCDERIIISLNANFLMESE
jgi:hypothetical protein